MRVLIVSSSKVYGSAYLEYITEAMRAFFRDARRISFVPYARPDGISHDDYTARAKDAFAKIGVELRGVHEWQDPREGIDWGEGIFIGGGNTYLLLRQLYEYKLIDKVRDAVIREGKPYMGTSAGANVACLTISTSNDMAIVLPPSLNAFAFVPFNINAHYIETPPDSKHMGETREARIKEFHFQNAQTVVGLREGAWLELEDGRLKLCGAGNAKIFEQGKEPYYVEQGQDVQFLMEPRVEQQQQQ